MIRRSELDRALTYVRRTDVHTDIEAVLRANPGGRPRRLPVDILLAAMLLTAQHTRDLKLTSVHKTLTVGLAGNVRRELGLQGLTIRQVRYLFGAIAAAYDHSHTRRPDLDAGTRATRQDALQDILDKLTSAAAVHLPGNGRYAIDGTAIDTPAALRGTTGSINGDKDGPVPPRQRGGHKGDGRLAHDSDARLGYRTETYNNRTKRLYGYQLIAFTRIGADSPTCRDVEPPALIDRVALVPGNEKGIAETIGLLDRFDVAGSPVHDIVVDRGFSDADAADFRTPLAQRRIDVTLDLKTTDHGTTPAEDGYLVIDGDPYCPTVPDELRTIQNTEDFRVKAPGERATPAEKEAFAQRMRDRELFTQLMNRRAQFRLESKGPARNGDGVRYSCPAKVGKLACTACPLSQHLPADVTRVTAPELTQPDGTTGTPKVCNSSVTVPLAVLGKHHQKHRWGSEAWRRSYDRRIRVEQSFGSLKGHTNGIIRPGWTLQVGAAKTSLLLGVAVAAHNLTTLLNWARRTRWTLDPLTLITIPTSDDLHDPDPGTGASNPAQPGAPPTT